jgi:hypothetical protein
MRRILLVWLAALSMAAQTRLVSPAWVLGDGAAHQVSASDTAKWVTVFALPTNSGTNCSITDMSKCPVVGESSVVIGSRGFPLLPGASYTTPIAPSLPFYSLAQIYYAAAAGDKLVLTWAK